MAEQDARLHIKRDEHGGNGRDAEIAVIHERLDRHDDEIDRSRHAREEYIPRIERMEQTLNDLAEKAVPKLIEAVEGLTVAVTGWNTTRSIVVKIAGWTLGIVSTLGVGVLSARVLGWLG